MGFEQDEEQFNRQSDVFNQQVEQLNQQQQLFGGLQENTEEVLAGLAQQDTSTAELRNLAIQNAEQAFQGRPSPVLDQFLKDVETQGQNRLQRNFGAGGETGTGALDVRRNVDLTKAQAIDQSFFNNLNTQLNAVNSLDAARNQRANTFLNASNNPLLSSQVLGQGISQLGKLSQFQRPEDQLAQALGQAGVAAFTQDPTAWANVIGNVSGLGSNLANAASSVYSGTVGLFNPSGT